ncbi:MAG: NlpC/P60 family protein [Patescibacteria group bacterium]
MIFRAVGNRCAVHLNSLKLPTSQLETLSILRGKGFETIEVDIPTIARGFVGKAKYRRGARLSKAPSVFDCSSFMKWLYAERGIWLPRRSIQQREVGTFIHFQDIAACDLLFTTGAQNYFFDDPADGVGHVGIVTDRETVIHAANSKVGIIETPLHSFVNEENFRGARRIIPEALEVITLITPQGREVETSDDIRWIVLQSL